MLIPSEGSEGESLPWSFLALVIAMILGVPQLIDAKLQSLPPSSDGLLPSVHLCLCFLFL